MSRTMSNSIHQRLTWYDPYWCFFMTLHWWNYRRIIHIEQSIYTLLLTNEPLMTNGQRQIWCDQQWTGLDCWLLEFGFYVIEGNRLVGWKKMKVLSAHGSRHVCQSLCDHSKLIPMWTPVPKSQHELRVPEEISPGKLFHQGDPQSGMPFWKCAQGGRKYQAFGLALAGSILLQLPDFVGFRGCRTNGQNDEFNLIHFLYCFWISH